MIGLVFPVDIKDVWNDIFDVPAVRDHARSYNALSGADVVGGLPVFKAPVSAERLVHWNNSVPGKENVTARRHLPGVVIETEGQRHHVSRQHLHQYANHAAWLEDNSRSDNDEPAHRLASDAMVAPVSRNWKGYWQRAA